MGVPVRLAAMAPRFAPAIQRLAADPAVGATSNLPSPYPPDGAIAFIRQTTERRARGEEFAFAVLEGETVVGACGLASVRDGAAELGYWIGRPYWSRGFASEAARLALRYAFGRLGLETVFAHCLKRNAASARVLAKAGMRWVSEGTMPASRWPDEPVERFVLTRAEWEAALRPLSPEAAPRGARRRRG